MENFSTRLRKFMEETGVNDNQLTIRSGLSNGIIRRVVREGKGLTTDNLEKILNAYPELSADWLLTGRGPMLIKKASPAQSEAYESTTITSSSPPTTSPTTPPTPPPTAETPTQSPTDVNLITNLIDTIRQQAIEIGMLRARLQQTYSVPNEMAAEPEATYPDHENPTV